MNLAEYGLIVKYITGYLILNENSDFKECITRIGDLVDQDDTTPDPSFRPKVEWEDQDE